MIVPRSPLHLFRRLLVAFGLVSFAVLAVLASGTFLILVRAYNEEVERIDRRQVELVAYALDTELLDRARGIYLRLSADTEANAVLGFFLHQPVDGNHYKIWEVHRHLAASIAGQGDVLHSATIYYSGPQMSISSVAGVRFDVGDPVRALQLGEGEDDDASMVRGFWRFRSGQLEYVRQYPFAFRRSREAVMVIAAPATRVAEVVSSRTPEAGSYLLFDASGRVFLDLSLPAAAAPRLLPAEALRAVGRGRTDVVDAGGERVVFTHARLAADGWYVGKLTPSGVFYRRSRSALLLLLMVAGSALGVCIVLSALMARNLSNPLERIVGAAAELVPAGGRSGGPAALPADPYAAMNELAVEMRSLHRFYQVNAPILRQQLLAGLLHGTAGTEEEIARRLELVGMRDRAVPAVCLVLEFHPLAFGRLPVEVQGYLVYDTVERIERQRTGAVACLAGGLDRHRVGAVLWSPAGPGAEAERLGRQIARELQERGGLRYSVGVGSESGSTSGIPESYRAAVAALRYRFLLPERLPLSYGETRGWDQNGCPPVDGGDGAFREALHSGRIEPVRAWLGQMERTYLDADRVPSMDGVLLSLAVIARELLQYGGKTGYEFDEGDRARLESFQERFDTLHDFVAGIATLAERIQQHHERRVGMARQVRAAAARRYIEEHYAEPISLESVAEQLRVTAGTLSRDLREAGGESFVDLVTRTRLGKSLALLERTREPVRAIAARCGFSSASYFIQQFRRLYGVTPREYRTEHGGAPPGRPPR